MACKLAENQPLAYLRGFLGIQPECHSHREHCLMGHRGRNDDKALAAPGAVIGYCQALFNYAGEPQRHSDLVIRCLEEIHAPWSRSHEMFWGYRQPEESAQMFVGAGMHPLLGNGRVPILITALDPAVDGDAIREIVTSDPPVHSNETVLVRVALNSEKSIERTRELLSDLLTWAHQHHSMPRWWPLLQGALSVGGWRSLQAELGEAWKYVNVAVNPFTPCEVFDQIRTQVTVAQIPIGLADGIADTGDITLATGMRIAGASDAATYNLFEYFERLASLRDIPTLIILGPSLPEWTDEVNQERIHALLPLLHRACNVLWQPLDTTRRAMVWKMTA